MLNKAEVDAEEERLREDVNRLADAQRKLFYQRVQSQIRDPDTYAVLNWFFIAGLHHFYLKRWGAGMADLTVFLVGVLLLFTGITILGWLLIAAVSLWELWALFRAQVIVQDWNNRLYQRVLKEVSVSSNCGAPPSY